ncbi:MAG TPA: septum formation protein Maf [Parachlamydiales bacterium]|nr:septum formation protein Maf [Parachlamydiales bacterium]
MEIVLGSQSPRRREILHFFSLPFQQVDPGFDETQVTFQGRPEEFVKEVSRRKALCLQEKFPEKVILTADTIVFKEGRLFMKPETLEEAACMLAELSGSQHQVFTGVTVSKGRELFSDVEETIVHFHSLSQDQIENYHRHFLPLDKAGGYAIQKGGSIIVKRIEGCYYNIMGLPLQTTRRLLAKVGIDLWDYLKSV